MSTRTFGAASTCDHIDTTPKSLFVVVVIVAVVARLLCVVCDKVCLKRCSQTLSLLARVDVRMQKSK